MAASADPSEDHQQHRRQVPEAHGGNPSNRNSSPTSENSDENPLFSAHWSTREQLILETGLARYSLESNVLRYAKIAMRLPKKTVRDVALRCKWMTSKESSRRRKEDHNLARKTKGRKGELLDPLGRPHLKPVSMFPMDEDDGLSYKAIGGAIGQLLDQNVQAFYQISENLAAYQLRGNINLFLQAQDNIFKILNNLTDMPDIMKHMPPLPDRLNEELANFIFTRTSLRMLS